MLNYRPSNFLDRFHIVGFLFLLFFEFMEVMGKIQNITIKKNYISAIAHRKN